MDKQPLWKPLLILVVILLCALAMYPPQQKLKPGPDLAGGTTLVYQVNVPDNVSDASQEIDDTIAVLRTRVDPNGVRNLIWRQQAGNRIEILMPEPQKGIATLRGNFVTAREALMEGNLSGRDLDELARSAGDSRTALVERISKGNPQFKASLEAFATAQDAYAAARDPYVQAQTAARKIEAELAALSPDASSVQRNELTARLQGQREKLYQLAASFNSAKKAAETTRAELMKVNVSAIDLDRIFALPPVPPLAGGKKPDDVNDPARYREPALAALIAHMPSREADIRAVADAYAAYEKVKGPLDDPNDLIAMLRGSGVLEFRVAPRPGSLPEESQYRDQLRTRGPRGSATAAYRWFPIDDIDSFAETRAEKEQYKADPVGYFASRRNLIAQPYGDQLFLLLSNKAGSSITESQPDWALSAAYPTTDSRSGFVAVGFELNAHGGQLMGALTNAHKTEPMAILLDGRVMSAPTINDTITTRGIISGGSGGFSKKELDYLIRTLKAGSLKARLSENPISIQKVGPQFGEDNLLRGLRAATYSFIFVCLFMAGYYFLGGLVANFVLFLNIVIILGVMSMIEATFTLPGIAGIILTIGMAVDANVLIFERVREELERGATYRTAIRLGYSRAMSTIVDSNITSIITCVILYYVGTADIKGFGLTLGIGLVASMFTAVFVSRVILEYYGHFFKPKGLAMLPIVFPAVRRFLTPNIDWIGKRYIFYTISAILMVIGLGAIIGRGANFLDIEFRSGTQVMFNLAEGKGLTLGEVRQRLETAARKSGLKDLAGEGSTPLTVGETWQKDGKTYAKAFNIATLAGGENVPGKDADAVSDAIKDAFADVLDVQQPVAFTGVDIELVTGAPVYAVKSVDLAAATGRAEISENAPDYIGGVAIVLEGISPPQSLASIRERISSVRLTPQFERLGYRSFEVIPITAAPHATQETQTRYTDVVVVTRDEQTNYAESPESLSDKGGLADTEWALIRAAMQRDVSLASVSNFSSQVSGTMRQQAIVAIVLSWLAILVYVWIRFGDLRFGFGAVLALVHDCIIAVGLAAFSAYLVDTAIGDALGITPFRLNLAMIASALTLIGFSVNDTIVIFDRIRENRGRLAHASRAIINNSINQTLSRTFITSGTTFIATVVLYVVGGPGVHGFAFVFLVGVVVGTYSSLAIASPVLLMWNKHVSIEPPTEATTTTATAAR